MTRDPNMKRPLIIAIIIAAMICISAAIMMPWMETLYDPALREKFTDFVDSLGFAGYLLIFGIQVIQVVIPIIPGEAVELMAGALYGGIGGLATCLLGSVLASSVIFIVVRRYGQPLLERLFPKHKLKEFGFVKDSRKLEAVIFILFLVPGTPKDVFTYIAGTTPIPVARFLAISTFARIPSVISSTFIGDQVISGNWRVALVITIITLVVGLAGIFLHDRAVAFCKRFSKKAKA